MTANQASSTHSANEVRVDTYTMAEAARLKGVSYHTVSRAVRRGALPAQRIGKMAFINAFDLQAWQPMVQRAPRKYRQRTPQLNAVPTAIDLASAERVTWAEQITSLIEMTRWTARNLPLDEHLPLLVDRLGSALEMHRLTVWRIESNENVAERIAGLGAPSGDFPDRMPLPLFPLLADLAARADDRPVSVDDYGLRQSMAIMVQPIRFGSRIHGAMIADRGGETFRLSEDQVVLAQTVVDQMAIALEFDLLRREAGVVSV
ncbi:MAG: helix-turn-helix domain-containing protein [Thermomicrobiales bacterium]|nr:helix-turn-helix domain-containing protein [Thermomicrobiales bacterium]